MCNNSIEHYFNVVSPLVYFDDFDDMSKMFILHRLPLLEYLGSFARWQEDTYSAFAYPQSES